MFQLRIIILNSIESVNTSFYSFLTDFRLNKESIIYMQLIYLKKNVQLNNRNFLQPVSCLLDSRIGFATINSTKSFLYSGFSL